jgi:hypothetical protein
VLPVRAAGYVPPTRFVHAAAPISTRNYPRPTYGNTYITNNTTIINNNYRYDSAHYAPHVNNFYGQQSPDWGDRWRYGCDPSPTFGITIGIEAHFGYGYYVYTPFYTPCVPSPYYDDPYVPAYVPEERVVVWHDYRQDWNDGDPYDYNPSESYNSYGDPDLNYGVSSLTLAYRDRNVSAIVGVLGTGQIAVFREGHYEYSCDSDDFHHMMADNCRASQTVSYEVVRVRHHGNRAVVRCRHRFRSHGGRVRTVYMTYFMVKVGDRYAVTDFMTSSSLL